MLRAIRIAVLLFILIFVGLSAWLTKARSTDWNNSLDVKIYPINADGSERSQRYIDALRPRTFAGVERFMVREVNRHGRSLDRPVRILLGEQIAEQPPELPQSPNMLRVMAWSLTMRLWVDDVTDEQDDIEPDISIFVRYHNPDTSLALENSVGVQKGMFGIVNAHTGRLNDGRNNLVIAHEFLHTLGATDKYDPDTGFPLAPHGIADPQRSPLYPQRQTEIMGGRLPLGPDHAVIPDGLATVIIGPLTAREIGLID